MLESLCGIDPGRRKEGAGESLVSVGLLDVDEMDEGIGPGLGRDPAVEVGAAVGLVRVAGHGDQAPGAGQDGLQLRAHDRAPVAHLDQAGGVGCSIRGQPRAEDQTHVGRLG